MHVVISLDSFFSKPVEGKESKEYYTATLGDGTVVFLSKTVFDSLQIFSVVALIWKPYTKSDGSVAKSPVIVKIK